jgi:hypothetical protein
MMISILEKISAYQLPELTFKDGRYRLPVQKNHVFSKSCEEFNQYYHTGSFLKPVRPSEQECEEFIAFTRKHGEKCKGARGTCRYKVCPWCAKNGVIHDKDDCLKMEEIKEHYGTWRRYFMRWSKVLEGHEWAIYISYLRDIQDRLYAKHCPCFGVLNGQYDDQTKIRFLQLTDARRLKLNMKKVDHVLNSQK